MDDDQTTMQAVLTTQAEMDPDQSTEKIALFYADGSPFDLSSIPGVVTTRKIPFTFNTPGILAGAPLYIPTVGDILLDGWVEVDTAWNGTTPKWDFSQDPVDGGWLGFAAGPLSLTTADIMSGGALVSSAHATAAFISGNAGDRCPPLKFTSVNPVKLWVTSTGYVGGGDPGSTQGSGVLHLMRVTPDLMVDRK